MTAPDDVNLDRVWTNVAAEVWRRHPGRLERTATKALRSPGLARALLTTPSLLGPWLIGSTVILAIGALVQLGSDQPLVWLIAPAVAAVGIAYAYGPGIDPAWELACSCAVSDRLVLLTRAVMVFAVNAGLGMAASLATIGTTAGTHTAQLTFGWLIPMTAVCALTLAVAVVVKSAAVGASAGVAAWLVVVLGRSAMAGTASTPSPSPVPSASTGLAAAVTDPNLYLPYLAVAACCAAVVYYITRPQRGVQ
jgi:hypothetical protein